jgi:hypothetical protein
MKISVLTLLATAMLATARVVPCDRGITHVESFSEHDVTVITTNEACWRVCFPTEPECPDDRYSKQLGPCWTCCVWEPEGVDEWY